MSKYTIKQILIDNWDRFILENPNLTIRPIVFEEVKRTINCGNPDLGYALYYCEHCNLFTFHFAVNQDFVILVVLNMLKIGLLIFQKKLFVVGIDISCSLFLNNFVYISWKIEIY